MDGSAAARQFFAGCYAECQPHIEYLWIAHLDDAYRCIHLACYEGNEARVDFPLREIVLDYARHGGAGLLIAHNHPSGNAIPSPADLTITRRLLVICEAAEIQLIDHLILGGDEWYSFREAGLL